MQGGKLKDRIIIQQPTDSLDDNNATETTWPTFATVWAEVAPAMGKEKLVAAQVRNVQTFIITIRYLAGVTTLMRISFDNEIYEIENKEHSVKRRQRFLKLTCIKGAANG